MKIIGFTGRKRSGKDTAGDVLIQQGWKRLSFAAPLKHMLIMLLKCQFLDDETIHRMVEGDLKETPTPFLNGRSPRYAMQKLGTEWGREMISESLWTDILLRTAVNFPRVVVTDVRFPNEVDAIKSVGGQVIRIVRPGVDTSDNHPSEALIDGLNVDLEITNGSTLQDFQKIITRVA